MKKTLLLLSLFISSIFASDSIVIGILHNKLFVSKKDANIGILLWHKQMEKRDSNISMEMVLYGNQNKLLEDYKNKKITHIVSDTTFYYKNKIFLDELTTSRWIMNQSEDMFEELYLVKNINSNFTLNNFDVSRIYYKTEAQRIWIEKLIYENSNKPRKILKKLVRVNKPNRLLFNIFFDKDDISIVSKDLYDSMLDLNPQVEQKIDIVKKSKKIFFSGIGMVRKDLKPIVKKALNDLEKEFETDPRSFDVVSFANIQRLYFIYDESKMEGINKFYAEYFNLRDKR